MFVSVVKLNKEQMKLLSKENLVTFTVVVAALAFHQVVTAPMIVKARGGSKS